MESLASRPAKQDFIAVSSSPGQSIWNFLVGANEVICHMGSPGLKEGEVIPR